MIPLFVVLPLGCAFFILLFAKLKKNFVWVVTLVCSFILLVYSIAISFGFKKDIHIYAVGGWKPPFGICMVVDYLSSLLLVVINLIGFIALLYSYNYIKKYSKEELYYTLFCLLLAGLNGVAISGDLFNLFVFLEIASISSYALVAFGVEAEELEASFKYLVLGSLASLFILLGIGIIFGNTSTLNMADIGKALRLSESKYVVMFAQALFIAGFGLKSALVPFHAWLADAHPAAPSPISAMLSGVVIKTIGVYALIRVIFNIIGFNAMVSSILIWLGILSMLIGVLLAIGQWDVKRLLAYHSISQIGYVVFGIGLGTPLGIMGGLFHLFNHSLFKSLLFFNAGALEYATGTRDLKAYGGLAEVMPITSITSLIASLSISGIPPFCGFWSKLIIILAAFQAKENLGAGVCVLVSMITLASFLKLQKYAFIYKKNEINNILRIPFTMNLSMSILAFLCIGVGLFFFFFIKYLIEPATHVLLSGLAYIKAVLGR